MWDDGTAVLVSGACSTGADRVTEMIWPSWGDSCLFLGALVMLDQLDIERFSFLGTLVTLGHLSPELGDGFCVCQAINLLGPVHVAAPVTVDSLIGQLQTVVVTLLEGLKDDVYSPASAWIEINREAVVGEPVSRPVIHDDHGLSSPPGSPLQLPEDDPALLIHGSVY
jgi:hypothetical protein